MAAVAKGGSGLCPFLEAGRTGRTTGRVNALGKNILRLILLARSPERIADHATDICEEIFYLVEGADIRHQTADA